MPALLAVGLEGFWGLVLSAIALPILGVVKGTDGLPLDSATHAFQVGSSSLTLLFPPNLSDMLLTPRDLKILSSLIVLCHCTGDCQVEATADNNSGQRHLNSILQLLRYQCDEEAERCFALHYRRMPNTVRLDLQSVGWLGAFPHPRGPAQLPVKNFSKHFCG